MYNFSPLIDTTENTRWTRNQLSLRSDSVSYVIAVGPPSTIGWFCCQSPINVSDWSNSGHVDTFNFPSLLTWFLLSQLVYQYLHNSLWGVGKRSASFNSACAFSKFDPVKCNSAVTTIGPHCHVLNTLLNIVIHQTMWFKSCLNWPQTCLYFVSDL